MKYCTRCVLPETFPGIQFDSEGVCQYCREMPDPEKRAAQRARLRARFEALVEEVRPRPGYHCLMAWSGGKDSTYTLWLLREQYGLRVLAFTLDNGFTSPMALKNVRVVAENLGVDHVIVKPRFDLLRRIFVESARQDGLYPRRALERASSICNSCMGIAKGIGLRLALEREIPLLVYGWSPGQIPLASALFRFTRPMLRTFLQTAMLPLETVAGDQIAPYFPSDEMVLRAADLPYSVAPLAFLDYNEEAARVSLRALGWEPPTDTDPNSTNCLLNAFANQVHLEQMGYHPYAMELAGLVREGYMSREEALARLEVPPAPEVVAAVRVKLGLPPQP
jgi:tRNA(Ile)-lysidine synthase TilS/MesJ